MILKKWPITEREYWESIEGLGGFIWSTRHALSHDRIPRSKELMQDLLEAQEVSTKLVKELFIKFGVIAPQNYPKVKFMQELPQAPFGCEWYKDWYVRMKNEYYTEEYGKIICSACPLSDGLDEFINSNRIPCGVFSGLLYELHYPFSCGMVDMSGWTREQLMKAIFDKANEIKKGSGEKAVMAFEHKEAELTPRI